MSAKLILSKGTPILRPVVLTVQLSPQESAAILRYTGRKVTKIELTEEELRALVPPGAGLVTGKVQL